MWQVDGSFVYSTAADGVVKVYQLRNLELHLIHSSDDVNIVAQSALVRRHIRSMATANQKVYFGDDGMNVKVLDWRKGWNYEMELFLEKISIVEICINPRKCYKFSFVMQHTLWNNKEVEPRTSF